MEGEELAITLLEFGEGVEATNNVTGEDSPRM